jgi:hypothetical protein
MGVEYIAERGLLAEDERDPVRQSHYPDLEDLPRDDVVALARWLRGQHGRARDIIRDRRRVRRGKADPRGATPETPSERGMAAKKQVFARALKRVNARLAQISAAARREQAVAAMQEALHRKRSTAIHHPAGDPAAGQGMRALSNRKARPIVHGARIGNVSQAGRNAQAARDAGG